MPHGKKYREASSRYDKEHRYAAREALELVKTLAPAKFDETVEVVYALGIDARKADQLVRGTVSLPYGTGKDVRVAVFCPPEKEAEAKEAGADIVGGKELVESLQAGKELNADVAIATPDMMAEVGKLGRVLGPRGLMPNPKSGTVTQDVGKTVGEAFNWMHRLDLACRSQLAAMATGAKISSVPDKVLQETYMNYQPQTRRPYGLMEWPALLRKLDRIDPSFRW